MPKNESTRLSVPFLSEVWRRIAALFDGSAWLLMLIGGIALVFTDPGLLVALLSWSAFALVLAGLVIVVSRIMFPQINLQELMANVLFGGSNAIGAAIVVASVVLFCSVLSISFVLWAK